MSEPGELLHVHALTLIGRAVTCLSWRGPRAHSGVHEARKAMRYARASLALGFSGSKAPWATLDRAIASIGRGLSQTRDAQAQVHTLDRLLKLAPEDETRADLRRQRLHVLAQRVLAMKLAQREDPGFAQRQRELRLLVNALDALPWASIDGESLRRSIALTLRRSEKAERRALDDGDNDDWHRWRRRRRSLLQQQTVLKACGIDNHGLPPTPHKLSQQLGESQDFAMLSECIDKDRSLPKPQRRRMLSFIRAARKAINRKIRQRVLALRDPPPETA